MTKTEVLKQYGFFKDTKGLWVCSDYSIKDPAIRQKKEKVLTQSSIDVLYVGELVALLKKM